ncbi:acireductone dioxygenase [Pseudomonas sp. R11-23-07]|uniref:acireductone dioxygenase n=1 Tax=Pseudomonas sp. R11-23-07 TaxID=658632 RepID=UPI000F578313|nr:acireductone dioxygenase [Pseudomonas sp. R11-23-07]AZF59274.1 1,2-dihydroxy-3-keto-5-methylthiopentene dioxygenase [Pseudomonas sp. R11-23-07]
MSYVAVYPLTTPDTPNKVLTHFDDIQSTLAEKGVRFARWQPGALEKGASEAQMIAAYQSQIEALGYARVKVISVTDDHPDKDTLWAERLSEHTCREDQAHGFIAGQGLFALRIGDYVYGVRCEKNDLLIVPANMPHWFDMGENPHFVALHMFNTAEGSVPTLTGNDIARDFAKLDD